MVILRSEQSRWARPSSLASCGKHASCQHCEVVKSSRQRGLQPGHAGVQNSKKRGPPRGVHVGLWLAARRRFHAARQWKVAHFRSMPVFGLLLLHGSFSCTWTLPTTSACPPMVAAKTGDAISLFSHIHRNPQSSFDPLESKVFFLRPLGSQD